MFAPLKDAIFIGTAFATGLVIDHNTLIPLGTLGAGLATAFWFGRKVQRVDDKLVEVERKLDRLPCVTADCGLRPHHTIREYHDKNK